MPTDAARGHSPGNGSNPRRAFVNVASKLHVVLAKYYHYFMQLGTTRMRRCVRLGAFSVLCIPNGPVVGLRKSA